MNEELAVRVTGLGKEYFLSDFHRQSSLAEAAAARLRAIARPFGRGRAAAANRAPESFWALDDVSFEVRRGETLGIIGRNGAGKSTLLKILGRITAPTNGRAEIHGRLSSLLEIGTGFNPDLSGRENVFLNGSILGMSRRQIEQRFDEIVGFAEIEKFIDMPVKHYSSGMYMRLAFSVAAHLDTDVLLADEVLAVGDAAFQEKCMGKIHDVAWHGRTVLFVSHSIAAIHNLCDSAIVLDGGKLVFQGEASAAADYYLEKILTSRMAGGGNPVIFPERPDLPFQVLEAGIVDDAGQPRERFEFDEQASIHLRLRVGKRDRSYFTFVIVEDRSGSQVFWTTDEDLQESPMALAAPGDYGYRIRLPACLLKPGEYKIALGTAVRPSGKIDRHDRLLTLVIEDNKSHRAMRHYYRSGAVVAPPLPWDLQRLG